MADRKVKPRVATEEIRRLLGEEPISPASERADTDKAYLSEWMGRAEEAILKHLELHEIQQAEQQKWYSSEIAKLRKIVNDQSRTAKFLRVLVGKKKLEPRPEKCPRCSCVKFYKKGFINLRISTLLNIKANDMNGKIPVQKFVCVNCGYVTHLEGPSALYYWVTASVNSGNGAL